jgi:DNA-binding response OmpR family regulator
MTRARSTLFLVCDDNYYTRRLVSDVLVGAGYFNVEFAVDGNELLERTASLRPAVVITTSRVPGLSGLEYTRMVRNGYRNAKRSTPIIVMTDTPTDKFLSAARNSGVDEMLVRPFTGTALLERVDAALHRQRPFIESVSYVGPCRRRRADENYQGPRRRFSDQVQDEQSPPWETEDNRELTRRSVRKISEVAHGLTPGDSKRLRDVFVAVNDTEKLADMLSDTALCEAARSLMRYINAVGASGDVDPAVLRTHVDAMIQLGVLNSSYSAERAQLVKGLVAVVDKRLGRKPVAAA